MIALGVEVQGLAAALAEVDALQDAAGRQELRAAVGVAVKTAVRGHIAGHYGGRANKLGGTSTQFYARMADSVISEVTSTGAEVKIPFVGAALHYYGSAGLPGGVIRPSGRVSTVTGKPIQFLTIPKHPAAHGKRASDFRALYSVPGGLRLQQGATRSDADPLYFIFARQATIKADPGLLPEMALMQEAAADAVADTMDDVRARARARSGQAPLA